MEIWILVFSMLTINGDITHHGIASYNNATTCKAAVPIYKDLLSAMDGPSNFKYAELTCDNLTEDTNNATVKTSTPPDGTDKTKKQPSVGCRWRVCLG